MLDKISSIQFTDRPMKEKEYDVLEIALVF